MELHEKSLKFFFQKITLTRSDIDLFNQGFNHVSCSKQVMRSKSYIKGSLYMEFEENH